MLECFPDVPYMIWRNLTNNRVWYLSRIHDGRNMMITRTANRYIMFLRLAVLSFWPRWSSESLELRRGLGCLLFWQLIPIHNTVKIAWKSVKFDARFLGQIIFMCQTRIQSEYVFIYWAPLLRASFVVIKSSRILLPIRPNASSTLNSSLIHLLVEWRLLEVQVHRWC